MSAACIITVAITGSLPRKKDNPAVPITVSEQIESTQAMKAHGVKPEVEAFDLSMIFKAAAMHEAGQLHGGPLHVQFVMGVKNAMPVDREVFGFYVQTLRRLAPNATWTGAGIGRDQRTVQRWSLELGGHYRTGLEDNVRLDRETLAPSNAALVRQCAELCAEYGRRPATVQEARALLALPAAR